MSYPDLKVEKAHGQILFAHAQNAINARVALGLMKLE